MQATVDTISTVVGFESDEATVKTMLEAFTGVSNVTTIGLVGSVTVMVFITIIEPSAALAVYWMVLTLPGVNVKLTYSGVVVLEGGVVTVMTEPNLPSSLDTCRLAFGITPWLAILVWHGLLGVDTVVAAAVVGAVVVPGSVVPEPTVVTEVGDPGSVVPADVGDPEVPGTITVVAE
jgi:hypothetical protein